MKEVIDFILSWQKKKKERDLCGPLLHKSTGKRDVAELLECRDWGRGDTTGMGSGAKGQQHRGRSPEPGKAIFRLLVKGVRIGCRG